MMSRPNDRTNFTSQKYLIQQYYHLYYLKINLLLNLQTKPSVCPQRDFDPVVCSHRLPVLGEEVLASQPSSCAEQIFANMCKRMLKSRHPLYRGLQASSQYFPAHAHMHPQEIMLNRQPLTLEFRGMPMADCSKTMSYQRLV